MISLIAFRKVLIKTFLLATYLVSISLNSYSAENEFINTVKTKLNNGQQVVGGTVTSSDIDIYCAMANSGFDFLWIEMQHSPLTFSQVAAMIRACPGPAIPFIRVPSDSEGDIQKATDIGALGIIVPLVDTIEKIENAISYAKYPPVGRRSLGGGQYRALWGNNYREIANENIMIVAMIENPEGAEISNQIAALDGVDIIFAASTDIGSFSGYVQGDREYEDIVDKIKSSTLGAGKYLAGPVAWKDTRDGYSFFQASSDTALIGMGANQILNASTSINFPQGIAPIEGEE
jgi:2-keto-3-deoxy-L-rhamnonate aldolase RhmA